MNRIDSDIGQDDTEGRSVEKKVMETFEVNGYGVWKKEKRIDISRHRWVKSLGVIAICAWRESAGSSFTAAIRNSGRAPSRAMEVESLQTHQRTTRSEKKKGCGLLNRVWRQRERVHRRNRKDA